MIDQSYGDSAYLDVEYASGLDTSLQGAVVAQGTAWNYWSSYGDLSNVAYGGTDSSSFQQLFLRGNVQVNSFQIATFSSSTVKTTIRIVDAATGMTLSLQPDVIISTTSSTISGPWNSTVGIALQLGPDLYNAAVSNIDLWVKVDEGTIGPQTTLSTTSGSTTPTTTTTSPTTAPPGFSSVVLDFQGDICDGGSACSNYGYIDQSYGDSAFLDVVYSTGLPAASAGTVAPQGSRFQWYNSYGNLNNVAFGPDRASMQQIHLRGNVQLVSFDMAAFSGSENTKILVIDVGTGAVLFDSADTILTTSASTFSGPWSASDAMGIAIQLGPDLNYAAVSNIHVWVDTTLGTLSIAPTTTLGPTTLGPTTSSIAVSPPFLNGGRMKTLVFANYFGQTVTFISTRADSSNLCFFHHAFAGSQFFVPEVLVNGNRVPLITNDLYGSQPSSVRKISSFLFFPRPKSIFSPPGSLVSIFPQRFRSDTQHTLPGYGLCWTTRCSLR